MSKISFNRDKLSVLPASIDINALSTTSPAGGITSGDITNWNTAFGWGDHSSAGYLTTVALNDNTDVTITTPTTDQVLKYDGAGWVNATISTGGLSNVVEDTTPQLGGNLDTNGFEIGYPSGNTIFNLDGSTRRIQIKNDGTFAGSALLNAFAYSPASIVSGFDVQTGAGQGMFRIRANGSADDGSHSTQIEIRGNGGSTIKAMNSAGSTEVPLTFQGSSYTFNNGSATFNNGLTTFNNGITVNTGISTFNSTATFNSPVTVDAELIVDGLKQGAGTVNLSISDLNGDTVIALSPDELLAGGPAFGGQIQYITSGSNTTSPFGIKFETTANDKGMQMISDGDILIEGQWGGSDPTHGITMWGHGTLGMTIDRDMMYTAKPFQFAPIPVGTTAPATPNEGDQWLDTTTTAVLKTYRGATWITIHDEKEGLAFYDSTNHRIVIRSNGAWKAMAAFVAL